MQILLLTFLISSVCVNSTILVLYGSQTVGVNAEFSSDWSFTGNAPGASYVAEMKVYTDYEQTDYFGTSHTVCIQLLNPTKGYCVTSLYTNTSSISAQGKYFEVESPTYNSFSINGGYGAYDGIYGKLSLKEVEDPNNDLLSNYTLTYNYNLLDE